MLKNPVSGAISAVVALVVLVCFVIAAILGVFVFGSPTSDKTPVITTILGIAGPTIGVLVLIVQQTYQVHATNELTSQINGHLEATARQAAATGNGDPNVPHSEPPANP